MSATAIENPSDGVRFVRERQERDAESERDGIRQDTFDPLDPATRSAAQLAPPNVVPPSAAPPHEVAPARAAASLEELLPRLVKRIAWAGDRKRGSVQLELGAGPHAGTVVTVHSEDGRLRVELHGRGADVLGPKIEARLERRGLDVERSG